MDPLVIDIPYFARMLLVYGFILPFRPRRVVEQYKTIWSSEGSPLYHHHLQLKRRVQEELGKDFLVVAGMRYGKPSIETALEELEKDRVDKVIVLPLYPQYSLAATESSIIETKAALKRLLPEATQFFCPPFYDHEGFIDSFSQIAAGKLRESNFDHWLISFHGLPERQIRHVVSSPPCLASDDCCHAVGKHNKLCYRAHCFETARLIAKRLKIPSENYSVGFQSRMGSTSWIKPHTDVLLQEFPQRGIRKLAVLVPSFVADCLETLEEIAVRGEKTFTVAGGERLTLIPSLNSDPRWARTVAEMIRSTN